MVGPSQNPSQVVSVGIIVEVAMLLYFAGYREQQTNGEMVVKAIRVRKFPLAFQLSAALP